MKVKIRKIGCSEEEVFNRMEELLIISERISNDDYIGSPIKTIRAALGLKELEFWELRYKNDQLFNDKFKIIVPHFDKSNKYIIRQCTFLKGKSINISDFKLNDHFALGKTITG